MEHARQFCSDRIVDRFSNPCDDRKLQRADHAPCLDNHILPPYMGSSPTFRTDIWRFGCLSVCVLLLSSAHLPRAPQETSSKFQSEVWPYSFIEIEMMFAIYINH